MGCGILIGRMVLRPLIVNKRKLRALANRLQREGDSRLQFGVVAVIGRARMLRSAERLVRLILQHGAIHVDRLIAIITRSYVFVRIPDLERRPKFAAKKDLARPPVTLMYSRPCRQGRQYRTHISNLPIHSLLCSQEKAPSPYRAAILLRL